FTAIALATTLVPLAALLLVAPLRRVAPTARVRPSLAKVVAAVWLPGVGLALTSAGFGAMTAFVALLFAARGWTVWPAFTTFAVALASPALGLIAAMTDIGTVFLASALSVLGAAPIALRLRHAPREN